MNSRKSKRYLPAVYTAVAIIVWVVATFIDMKYMQPDKMMGAKQYGFLDLLVVKVPEMLLFHRILYVLIGLFLSSMVLQYRILKQLRTSERKLKKANSVKDKLFAIISHDLKSPFTGFMLYSELLMDDGAKLTKGEIYEIGRSINFSSKKLYDFLDNLLVWAKSQMSHSSLKPVSFELNEVVNETFEIYSQLATNKDLKLINNVYKGINVLADKDATKTILRNLVSNSIKYSRQGGTISIFVAFKTNGEQIEIKVVDSGIGMTKETLSKLFVMEKKVSEKGTNGEQGTGLGLTLVKDIIDSMESSISVTSTQGVGTMISFTLPILNNSYKNMEEMNAAVD